MDFAIPSELEPVLAAVRRFVATWVRPLEARLGEGFAALEPELERVRARARAEGLWMPQAPADIGGMGLGVLAHGLVSEVLGTTPLGHYALGCQAPDAGNVELLHEFASEAQRVRYLLPLARGEIRSAFGMTEPEHAGSNPVWLSTRAVQDGDDWILDGHKWFTSSVDGAAFVIVMAVTDPEAAPHERASMLIVPTDAAGFEHVRNVPIMGERGEGWMSHGEIRLHGCRVGADALLGPRGRGFALAQARLGPGRIHHCMRWLGICERSLAELCGRALTRELSPGRTLSEQQTIQDWIAQARVEIDAARLLVLRAAWTIDNHGTKAARDQISMVKYFTADVMLRTIDRAIQVHGAAGMTDDLVLSHFYRHERGARIYDGPDEVHRAAVARRTLAGFRRGPVVDGATPIRAGEELDLAALDHWLATAVPELHGALSVEQFPSGYSNLTYLVKKGERELVLRRPPVGVQVKSGHDMDREFRVLQALAPVYPPAPRPIARCDDASILGAPFYVMERRRGVILRREAAPELGITPPVLRRMCEALVDQLAALHAIDYEAVGLGELGKPEGYVRRQVEGWIARWARAQTSEVGDIDSLGHWLVANLPTDGRPSLVHNDFKFDNVMLDPADPTRIVAVLDWEMCTIGDPLLDIGTTLGYWVEAGDDPAWKAMAFGPTAAPGAMTRRELAERWGERTGRDVGNMLYYYAFALLKIAVIVQQIYYRYAKGFTKDARFAQLDRVVAVLGRTATRAIEHGRY